MDTEKTSSGFLTFLDDGMFTATDISEPELLDQCRALVFAITELTNTTARDCLTWVMMERVELLRQKMDEGENTLTEHRS